MSSSLASILIVDDDARERKLLETLLHAEDYSTLSVASGEDALSAIAQWAPDLILLDIMMPGLDGYEVLRRLQQDAATATIPVIFLTAMTAAEDEKIGLDLGAVDYISKPINPAIVLARVHTQLQLKFARDLLQNQNVFLEHEVEKRTREVMAIQDVTIRAITSLAETRDNETGNHIRRTQFYVKALAEHLQTHPRFSAELTADTIQSIFKSAPLHDIGKVGIPDSILLKPGKLDFDEFEIMKTHTTLGRDAIVHAEHELGESIAFLRHAKEIALSHQEKWDGSGYPQGLVGEAIPLSARLMALADVYDALISRRVYKPPFSHEKALEIIREGRGSHFDPDIVDGFEQISEAFAQIARQYSDEPASNE